jgi:aryl-alcohol dehydrogenase-like predicted oxidoreductase
VRYRPFAHAGQSLSALTLALPPGLKAREADALVCTALECGINSYLIELGDLAGAEALGGACAVVERRLLMIHVRTRPPLDRPDVALRETLAAGLLGSADTLILDLSGEEAVDPGELMALDRLRHDRLVTRIGLWGEGEAVDAQMARFAFDLLAIRYNIRSGWLERNRIKAATQQGLAILGFGFHVDAARALAAEHAPKNALQKLFHKPAPAVAHAYDFLRQTPGWTPEQLTLAYALTEPALASVVVNVGDAHHLETLAAAVERELPSAAAAQIEIARFAA